MILKITDFKNLILISLPFVLMACGDSDEPIVNEPTEKSEVVLFINEIYATGSPDWVEIYNPGDESIDLEGFKIYDDLANKYTIPAGIKVDAKGYKLLYCDDTATGDHTNFKLSSNGETIWLESVEAKLVDKVTFPETTDGTSYGRFGDGSDNWKISGVLTEGTSNGSSEVVSILDVDHLPIVVTKDDKVLVRAELSNTEIKSASIIYSVDNVIKGTIAMTMESDTTFTGEIPAIGLAGTITYYVKVIANSDDEVTNPLDPTKDSYSYLINTDVLPSLFINEFLAVNKTCCPDKAGALDEFDDWVEIYNAGTEAVNIADFYVSDNAAKPFGYQIPSNAGDTTLIAPGGYLLLWADSDNKQGALHMNFKLGRDGESIGLYYLDGRTIDEYTFGPQTEDVSEGRSTDGGADWKKFNEPTPKASN